jgi:DNA mismatch endonuclease Vsr
VVFGKPDFVFLKQRVAVFVDGCFWHACPRHCTYVRGLRSMERPFDKLRVTPKRTGRGFWLHKLARNIARDRLVNRQLRRLGWRVVRVWSMNCRQSPAANAPSTASGKPCHDPFPTVRVCGSAAPSWIAKNNFTG